MTIPSGETYQQMKRERDEARYIACKLFAKLTETDEEEEIFDHTLPDWIKNEGGSREHHNG